MSGRPPTDTPDYRSVLLVEDDPAHVELIRRAFERTRPGVELRTAATLSRAEVELGAGLPDVVVTDWRLPDGQGADLLRRHPDIGCPLVVMTGQGDESTAVEAMKAGALDYVVKSDVTFSEMPRIVERALREWALLDEKQRLEGELRVSQRMEAIGRLAGGIAHDFNNLLTVIGSYTEFCLEEVTDAGLRENLEAIRSAQESAAALSRQLLAFGGQQEMAPTLLSLGRSIGNVTNMMRRVVGEQYPVEVHMDGAADHVMADPTQLEQVMVNLIVNARDAMPAGGAIEVDLQRTVHDAPRTVVGGQLQAGDYMRISIRDHGVGMTKETIERIFDPFFTTKPKGAGTGLGLSSAFGIVRQLSGGIEVESEEGVGTTFFVYLPAAAAAAHAGAAAPLDTLPDEALEGSETVLLAEDDPAIRMLVSQMLERRGYRVVTTEDGSSALEWNEANQGQFDLLISDLVMPGINGYELALELRSTRPDLRILFISGYADESAPPDDLRDEAVRFLAKPFTGKALCTTVRELLDRSSDRTEAAQAGA